MGDFARSGPIDGCSRLRISRPTPIRGKFGNREELKDLNAMLSNMGLAFAQALQLSFDRRMDLELWGL